MRRPTPPLIFLLAIIDANRSEVYVPTHKPALTRVAVDGHGQVFVFPWFDDDDTEARPVDVFSAAGERLFSGWVPELRWSDAHGDFVYGHEADDDTGEERIIRFRMIEPF